MSGAEPVIGHAYEVHSRNLEVAAYAGAGAFVGIREKFGELSLFTEWYGPTGTVRSVERDLGPVPADVLVFDHLRTCCGGCGLPVIWRRDGEAPTPGRYVHKDGTELEEGARARAGFNQPLFDFLANMEKDLGL